MQVEIAVAKVPKFGLMESGDSVEIIERPRGGLTAILADGQTHGRPAKRVSQFVVAKAIGLIADGVRDGAVARGVHDALYAARDGKVSTELTMLSADFRSKTLVITRNSHVPVLLRHPDGQVERLSDSVEPIGVHESMRPLITELPLRAGMIALAMTDGIYSAGSRYTSPLNLDDVAAMVATTPPVRVHELVDGVLERAIELDRRRPADDMAVVAMGVCEKDGTEIRRMAVRVPT
jgi:serine phosphatase RsbU (regulator of sigma subunit)